MVDPEDDFTYSYDSEQFVFETERGLQSKFDKELERCWNKKMQENCFRYDLRHVETKLLPGNYHFVAQLNIKRAVERRKPQSMHSVIMPFDPEKFHFGKVNKKEVLFKLLPLHWKKCNSGDTTDEPDGHALIINVSPLEHCNSLLVPNIDKNLPQVVNFEGLRLAIETVLISHLPALKVGMNSLGAYASVNHLHFHAYYLKYDLYIQFAPVKHLVGDCYELIDYPAPGFAFQLTDKENVLPIARSVMKLVEYLQKEKIAHNIIITRGKHFSDISNESDVFQVVRIFVWARESSFGAKQDIGFNPALCELAGHLPIKERDYYDRITEDNVASILQDICHNMHIRVKKDIMQLYS